MTVAKSGGVIPNKILNTDELILEEENEDEYAQQ